LAARRVRGFRPRDKQHDQTIADEFGGFGQHSKYIETIGRRGYRWIAPVTGAGEAPSTPLAVRRMLLSSVAVVASAVVLLAAGVAAVRWRARDEIASLVRSLAVLPLQSIGGSPEQNT